MSRRTTALLVVIALAWTVEASGAPAVSTVTGAIQNGSAITIQGNGFGTKLTGAPAIWDDVSYPSLNNQTRITTWGDAAHPWWSGTCGDVWYKTTNARGTHAAHYTNEWSTNSYRQGSIGNSNAAKNIAGVQTTKVTYITWWLYIGGDPNPCYPGGINTANCPSGYGRSESNKWFRFNASAWGEVGGGYVQITPINFNVGTFTSGGNFSYCGTHPTPSGWVIPGWNRVEVVTDATNSSAVTYQAWVNGVASGPYTFTCQVTNGFDNVGCLGADFSNTPAAYQPIIDFGEIYADNTRARVELGDAATWAACRHREIQIPLNWSANAIACTVNTGTFSNGATAYLYVFDDTGAVNASGIPVTINSSGPTDPGPPGQPGQPVPH